MRTVGCCFCFAYQYAGATTVIEKVLLPLQETIRVLLIVEINYQIIKSNENDVTCLTIRWQRHKTHCIVSPNFIHRRSTLICTCIARCCHANALYLSCLRCCCGRRRCCCCWSWSGCFRCYCCYLRLLLFPYLCMCQCFLKTQTN